MDTDKLKRLAEACVGEDKILGLKLTAEEARQYAKTILALIAENERLVDRVAELEEGLLNMKMVGDALGAGLTVGQAIEILHSEYFARIDSGTSK